MSETCRKAEKQARWTIVMLERELPKVRVIPEERRRDLAR
jgi:hypothetical protein